MIFARLLLLLVVSAFWVTAGWHVGTDYYSLGLPPWTLAYTGVLVLAVSVAVIRVKDEVSDAS